MTVNLFPSQRTTSLPGGYIGKILRVDLTTGSMRNENLPEKPVMNYPAASCGVSKNIDEN